MKIDYKQRGFAKGEFKDGNGHECSIQESSAARDEGLIWFGIDEPELRYFSPFHSREWRVDHTFPQGWSEIPLPDEEPGIEGPTVMRCGRMHLTQSQVAALLPSLIYFVQNGLLPRSEEEESGEDSGT